MKARKTLMSLCLLLALPLAAQQKNYVSEVWVADQGNGKYKNPVLYADYSDPDACRVGDDYYMTSSSFTSMKETFGYKTPEAWFAYIREWKEELEHPAVVKVMK